MKEQIFRLCKRLKNCTLNDFVQMLEVDEAIIETALLFLEQEESISINNGVISTLEIKPLKEHERKNLYLMMQHISSEEFDFIIKGFCLNIPPQKMCHFVKVGDSCICDYYGVFRRLIYEKQFKELMQNFMKKPQQGRYRKFYEKYAYFYVYNNKVFVSEKLLRANIEKEFKKDEIREFKRMYCYLARVESHNSNQNYMHHRLAEFIWRRERSFEDIYSDLKSNIIS